MDFFLAAIGLSQTLGYSGPMRSSFDAKTLRILAAAIACISIVGIGLSLTIPLLALRLEAAGYPARINGLHTAVSGLATLIGAPLTPYLARSLGMRRLLFVALGVALACLIAFAYTPNYNFWLLIRVFFGLSLTVIFVISEYWISAAAPPERRGAVMGVYATILAVGFAIGPALLSLTGAEGVTPFLAGAALMAVASLPVAFAAASEAPEPNEKGGPHWSAILAGAPVAMMASLLYGAIETGGTALLPVFGLRAGFNVLWATFQVTVFALGNVVFQIPIGMLADRMDKGRLLAAIAIFGLAGAMILPLLPGAPLLYAVALFVWGGVVGGLYSVGLAQLGAQFAGAELASANAAYIMMYAAGMLAGPPAIGYGLDLAPGGLFWALAAFFALYLLLIAAKARRFA